MARFCSGICRHMLALLISRQSIPRCWQCRPALLCTSRSSSRSETRSEPPWPGLRSLFTVTSGGGTLSTEAVTTDSSGHARTTLTLGSKPGTNTVTATVGLLDPVTFIVVGVAIPRTLRIVSGGNQQGPVGIPLGYPFVVLVLDQNGEPIPGAVVTFAVTAGDGTLSVETATTDSRGLASSTLTLGSGPGTHTVEVTVADQESVTFSALALATLDFNGDGEINFADFFLFADAFGTTDARFDLDGSGVVDFGDFFIFADAFGQPARAKLLALAAKLIGLPEGSAAAAEHAKSLQQPDGDFLLPFGPWTGAAGDLCINRAACSGSATGAPACWPPPPPLGRT